MSEVFKETGNNIPHLNLIKEKSRCFEKISKDVCALTRKINLHLFENNFVSGLKYEQYVLIQGITTYLILNQKKRKENDAMRKIRIKGYCFCLYVVCLNFECVYVMLTIRVLFVSLDFLEESFLTLMIIRYFLSLSFLLSAVQLGGKSCI